MMDTLQLDIIQFILKKKKVKFKILMTKPRGLFKIQNKVVRFGLSNFGHTMYYVGYPVHTAYLTN